MGRAMSKFKVGDKVVIKNGSALGVKNWPYGGRKATVCNAELDRGNSIVVTFEGNGETQCFNHLWLEHKKEYKWEEL